MNNFAVLKNVLSARTISYHRLNMKSNSESYALEVDGVSLFYCTQMPRVLDMTWWSAEPFDVDSLYYSMQVGEDDIVLSVMDSSIDDVPDGIEIPAKITEEYLFQLGTLYELYGITLEDMEEIALIRKVFYTK